MYVLTAADKKRIAEAQCSSQAKATAFKAYAVFCKPGLQQDIRVSLSRESEEAVQQEMSERIKHFQEVDKSWHVKEIVILKNPDLESSHVNEA